MPEQHTGPAKTIEQVVDEVSAYPVEAFDFVREGLNYSVRKIHAERKKKDADRHISGQQLCEGLREYALLRWGMMARTVLRRWNLTGTEDFGRIVFALIEGGWLRKTEQDSLDDFKRVYTFKSAFDDGYRIESKI